MTLLTDLWAGISVALDLLALLGLVFAIGCGAAIVLLVAIKVVIDALEYLWPREPRDPPTGRRRRRDETVAEHRLFGERTGQVLAFPVKPPIATAEQATAIGASANPALRPPAAVGAGATPLRRRA